MVLVLVLGALTAWFVWTAAHKANPPVAGRITSFEVRSDTETVGSLTIERPNPAVPARCLVIVQAVTYDRVGEKPVEIGPGSEWLTVLTVSVRTFKRGTSMSVENCFAAG